MNSAQWSVAKDAIQTSIDDLTEQVAGGVSSWDHYNKTVGRVAGLREALDAVDRVLNPPQPRNDDE